MARRKPTALGDLDALVDAIVVDAYGDDEPQSAFLEVFNQEVRLPAAATVLGMAVEVVGLDYHDQRRGVTARCGRDGVKQELAVVDLNGWRPSWLQTHNLDLYRSSVVDGVSG